MQRRFTWFVIGAMILGVVVGFILNQAFPDPAARTEIADGLSILTTIFLRLIKMIIAPLVFSTLVVGIAHMEDTAAIGRVGAKTIGWFLSASLVSLLIGLIMVHIIQPGVGMPLALPPIDAKSDVAATALSLKDFITHVFPASIIEALASTITTQGIGVLLDYARFVGGFYLSLAVLWGLLILAAFMVIGPRVKGLLGVVRDPAVLAFSTASSEAAYPKILDGLPKFGVSRRCPWAIRSTSTAR